MQLSRRHILLLSLSVIALLAAGVFIQLANGIATDNTPYGVDEQPTRGFDSSEDSISPLRLTDDSAYLAMYPQSGITILNQIYLRHYELTKNLDKVASINGTIQKTSTSSTFTITFSPSNDALRVTVTPKNDATQDYDISVEKAGGN